MGFSTLLAIVAVLAPCGLIKYLLHDAIFFSHQSVIIEEPYHVANISYTSSELDYWPSAPRWSGHQLSLDRVLNSGQQLAGTVGLLPRTDVQCHVLPKLTQTSCHSLSCGVCSSWACNMCAVTQLQCSCSLDHLGFRPAKQLQGSKLDRNSTSQTAVTAVDTRLSRPLCSAAAVAETSTGELTAAPGAAELASEAVTPTEDADAVEQQRTLQSALAITEGNSDRLAEEPLNPDEAAIRHTIIDSSEDSRSGTSKTHTSNLLDMLRTAIRSSRTLDHSQLADIAVAPPDTAGICRPPLPTPSPGIMRQSSVADLVCLEDTVSSTAAAASEAKAFDADLQMSESLDAQPEALIGPHVPATATAASQGSLQQSVGTPVVQSAKQPLLWQTEFDMVSYLTPSLILQTVNKYGITQLHLASLVALLLAVCAAHAVGVRCWRFFGSRDGLATLPQSVTKDPKKLDLYFTLRKLSYQQAMWFRLLGVSGVAVREAAQAQQRYKEALGQVKGVAKLARDMLQRQHKHLQSQHSVEIAALQQELQEQSEMISCLHQQQEHDQQVHQDKLQQQQQEAEQQRAALKEQHQQLVDQQRQQIEQHWHQQLRDRQTKYAALQARERELAADVRSKADVIAEQRASVASLSQQLIEVKSEKAGLSSELQRVREQLVVEKSRVEFILHEEQAVKGQAADVNQKYESLQDQLSGVRSCNAQLTAEVQHLQASCSAAETTIQDLQQQLANSSSQLSEAHSQATESASKIAQLEERTKGLQEQLINVQGARDELTGQLRELQGVHTAAEASIKGLQEKLSSAESAVADGRTSIVQLQEQQRQLEIRVSEEKDRYAELHSKHQQLQASHSSAEATINEQRGEKQALERKAEQLQQQLSSTLAELGQLRSDYATAAAQLRQSNESKEQLQQQLSASLVQIKQQSGQLDALQRLMSSTKQQLQDVQQQLLHTESNVEQLTGEKKWLGEQLQVLEGIAAQQEAELRSKQQQIKELTNELQMEHDRYAQAAQQLRSLSTAYTELEEHNKVLDQNLIESIQLLEEREADLQGLQEDKAALDTELTAVRANLQTRNATLREAQASLSETEGKLHEEYEKNWELGRENMQLQQEVDRLKEDNRQFEQELDEVTADRDSLSDKLEALTTSYGVLLEESEQIHSKTEGLLAENLDSLVELEGKFTAAQAGLAAVTKERDELAKKLFWAEIARDQHGAAKNLANQEAIAARKDLLEEKLIKTRQATSSPAHGAAEGAANGGAASGGGASGGTSNGENRVGLLRTNSKARAWPQVQAGYLQQQHSDAPATARVCSSNGYNSPRSPIHSPTPSADAAMYTPNSIGAEGLSSNANSKARSAPCTPRTADDEAGTGNVTGSSSVTSQQLQQQVSERQQCRGVAADGVEVMHGSRLRRSASMPLVPLLLQAERERTQLPAAGSSVSGQQQSGGEGLAAAVAGLRQNFQDSTSISHSQGLTTIASPQDKGIADQKQSAHSPSESVSASASQQQPMLGSPEKLMPPPLESSQSPSFAGGTKSAERTSCSISSRADHRLLPLNLSPVPFEMSASLELGASAAINSSPGASSSIGMVPAAAAESPTPRNQQHGQEEFVTPLTVSCRPSTTDKSTDALTSAADAVPTPYFTPKQSDILPAGACHAEPETPEAIAVSSLRKIAAGSDSFMNSPASGSPPHSSCSAGSLNSAASLDDEADVLIGSMTEAEFASAVGSASQVTPGSVGDDAGKHESGVSRSSVVSQQQAAASEALASVAQRQQSRLAHGSSDSLLQHAEQQAAGATEVLAQGQQQQQKKLTKNQKKKMRQKQKRLAQQQQQHGADVNASGGAMLDGWVQQQSLEHALASSITSEGFDQDAGDAAVHLGLVDDSAADAPAARGQADSPPKMFLRGPTAGAGAGAVNSGLVGGRYGSPVKRRTTIASPVELDASAASKSGLQSMLSKSIASSVEDVSSPAASAAGAQEGLLMAAGSGGSRLRSMKSGLGSPSRASSTSMKSLVAHGRLRDAELGSSGGSSNRGSSSPQRFSSKFVVGADASPAGAAAVSSSCEVVRVNSSAGRTGTADQGLSTAVLPDPAAPDSFSTPLRMVAFDPTCAGAAGELLEVNQYRSSVQWKALSDSVTLSASELQPGSDSRSRGVASPAASESTNWTVAENVLYFE